MVYENIMKDYLRDESVRSSPVPDINFSINEIQKRIKQVQKQSNQIKISDELSALSRKHPNTRRPSHQLLTICLKLFFISAAAYEFISFFIPIPCVRTMFYKQKIFLNDFQNFLTDITKTKIIAEEYSKNWSANEPVILAVDACSVNPTVSIFSNGTVEGLIEKYQMSKDLLTQSSTTISVFEEWMQNVSSLVIDSYFVYHVQPLNPSLNNFILHIVPSKGGKGNNSTISTLKKLAKILQSVNITVVSFSSDGDTFATPSHTNNIKKHYNKFKYNTSPNITEPLFLSDPLHILKRVRYHFIPIVTDPNQMISLLNLPSLVFRNDRASKMHDKLPLLFFQMNNYLELRKHQLFNYSIFILPYTLLLSSLSDKLEFEKRLLYLNIARIILEKNYFPHHLTSYPNHIAFKQNIIRDCLSTVLTILDILNLPNVTIIHLNRLGTNPLEHTFGIIRMRSKDHHNSKRFILEAGKINALIKINEELILENIKNRQLQFGKVISLPNEKSYSDSEAKEYVDSLFAEAKNGYCNKACKKIHSIFLNSTSTNNKTNKCYLLNSNDILLAPNSNILIEKRQNAASELNKKCGWSK